MVLDVKLPLYKLVYTKVEKLAAWPSGYLDLILSFFTVKGEGLLHVTVLVLHRTLYPLENIPWAMPA